MRTDFGQRFAWPAPWASTGDQPRLTLDPALYVGRLRHRRFRPRPHAFTYELFMVLVDVDHIDTQMTVSPFTSVNHFNWATFDHRDHLGDPSQPLRERLRTDAATHGIRLPDGPIFLLTHLRYLGYAFNPISLYYCFDNAGRLATVLAEVHNTFGETRMYWMPPGRETRLRRAVRWRAEKTMHVSPFMGMHVDYDFVVTPPGQTLVAHMTTTDHDEGGDLGPNFDATLTLTRRPWSASAIHRALARHPLMTAKVIGAIHLEALRLWARRIPFHPHPGAALARRSDRGAKA